MLVQLLRINEQILTNAYNLGVALLVSTYFQQKIYIYKACKCKLTCNWNLRWFLFFFLFCCAAYLLLWFKTLLLQFFFSFFILFCRWFLRRKSQIFVLSFLIPNFLSRSLPIMHYVQILFQITFRSTNTKTYIICGFFFSWNLYLYIRTNQLVAWIVELRLSIKARVAFCMLPLKMIFSHSFVFYN